MTNKPNGAHSLETDWARAPNTKSFWKGCGHIFYNPEENSCFGRTPKRWANFPVSQGIVLTFYAIFYAVLAALFSLCMAALFATIDDKKPSYILASSLIGLNPGVSFRPLPRDGLQVTYDVTNETQVQTYVQDLADFLKLYEKERWLAEKSAHTNSCSPYDRFGYPDTPCFLIKINKIYGWVPELYGVSSLPADMPEDLKKHIKELPKEEQNQVWISCFEEHKESGNDTQFEYPWGQGLPGSFYPYTNTEGYKSPLVAVKITKHQVGQQIVVRCRAWAKNVIYNKSIRDGTGYARILLHAQVTNSTKVVPGSH